MSLLVVFRPESLADLLQTHEWYEQRQPGLGDSFLDRMEDTILRIQKMPAMYATYFVVFVAQRSGGFLI